MARRTPSVLNALNKALRAAKPADNDAAAVALAKRYALELDDAAVISRAAAKTLRKVEQSEVEPELYEELLGLATRIEETHVAALVGPKLLAALEQLQLTPRARTGVLQGGGALDAPSKASLDELRNRRNNRAAPMDPSSP